MVDGSVTSAINYEHDSVSGQRIRTYSSDEASGGISGNGSYTPAAEITVTDTEYQYDSLSRLKKVIIHERFGTPLTRIRPARLSRKM